MPSIGIRQYGLYKKQPENAMLIPNILYESHGEFDRGLPDDIALGFLKDWKEELLVKEGIIANYLEVNGNKWTVQWKSPTEKSLLTTIVIVAIVAIAVTVSAKYLADSLTNLAHETGQLVSLLGPENLNILMQIITLIIVLQLISPLLESARKVFRK